MNITNRLVLEPGTVFPDTSVEFPSERDREGHRTRKVTCGDNDFLMEEFFEDELLCVIMERFGQTSEVRMPKLTMLHLN